MSWKSVVWMVGLSIFMACNLKTNVITEKVFGTYAFEFPSKELEILIIKKDSTFVQKIYKTADRYDDNSPPLYHNEGTWSVEGGNELYFENWLKYCYLRYPDSILLEPVMTNMGDVFWQKPTKKHEGQIDIFGETGYVFRKIPSVGNVGNVPN